MGLGLSTRLTIWDVVNQIVIVDVISGSVPIPQVWAAGDTLILDSESSFNASTGEFLLFNDVDLPRSDKIGIGIPIAIAKSPNSQLLAEVTLGGYVSISDIDTGNEIDVYLIDDDRPYLHDVLWNPNSKQIAVVADNGKVYLVNVDDGSTQIINRVDGRLFSVDWHPTENLILYTGVSNNEEPIINIISVDL